jgi:hypothetical protein
MADKLLVILIRVAGLRCKETDSRLTEHSIRCQGINLRWANLKGVIAKLIDKSLLKPTALNRKQRLT